MRADDVDRWDASVVGPGVRGDAPLFSLPLGEGAGALLAAAAGDVAGGSDPGGYSAVTQSATVLAYHLIQHGEVDREELAAELLTVDGTEDGVRAYRGESADFRRWLDSAHAGEPSPSSHPSSEPAGRMTAVGVWFRRDPDDLVKAAVSAARLTHLDATTVVAAAAAAGAVAGSCFVQSGQDLVTGAAETAERAMAIVGDQPYRFADVDRARSFPARLRGLAPAVTRDPREIVSMIATDNGPFGCDGAVLGIVLGAAHLRDPVRLIEVGAMSGGSEVGSIVGAIVGARSGFVRWPWRVPNDTWFAEIGRRLVDRAREVRDLPIPFAVEERITLATRDSPSSESL